MLPSTARRWAGALLVWISGCAGAAQAPPPELAETQSFADAIKMLCDVDKLAGLSADDDLLGVGQKRSEWLADKIENPDGIYFKTILSVKPAEDQASAMREQAKKVGIERCALADSIEEHATGGISP
jgi:hypothetical protein